ncbi:MAG TPA: TolC family protein [Anaeromyxobacteraceae bacterium]|nr:TolC family protein [Anaeromyxobacteraceae bacterium]
MRLRSFLAIFLSLAFAPDARAGAPLTLDDALAAAAKANLDLRLAGTDRAGADVEEYASWSGVLPRLDLQAQFGNNYNSAGQQLTITPVSLQPLAYEKLVVPIPSADFENYLLALTLSLPLFDGFTSWARISESQALARASRKQYDEAALSVAATVTARFYEVVRAEKSLEVLEEAARRSEELVRRTDALYQAGRAQRADTYSSRVTLGNDRIALEQQRSRLADARVALSTAIGRDADPEMRVVPSGALEEQDSWEPPPQGELVELAKRMRPLLAADRERVAAAGQEVRAAQGGYWPAVSAQVSYARQSPWLTGTYGVYGDLSQQYAVTAGITVNWNLFEGRATSAAVQRANVSEERARLQAEQALQQVTGDIARARSSYVVLARSASLAAESLRAAEENLRLAKTRFEAGAATQLEITDALLKLTQSQLALLQVRVDTVIARSDLNRAVGGAL